VVLIFWISSFFSQLPGRPGFPLPLERPPGHLQETLCAPRLIDLVNQFSRLFYYRALAGATAQ
jgi:hypothetical protein